MNPILWKEDYRVGVHVIDDQHQVFFSNLNELYMALYANKAEEWLSHVFNQIDNYIKFHFATEEKYFDAFKYEFREEHVKMHNEFSKKIDALRSDFEDKKGDIAPELVKILEDWFVNHINKADRMYVKCFNENGLK